MKVTYDGWEATAGYRWKVTSDIGIESYVFISVASSEIGAEVLRTIADQMYPETKQTGEEPEDAPEDAPVSIADSVRGEFRQELDEANKRLDDANERLDTVQAKNKELAKTVKQMTSRKRALRLAVDSLPSGWTVTSNLLARANDIRAYIETGTVRNR